jgi:hypothetical protein
MFCSFICWRGYRKNTILPNILLFSSTSIQPFSVCLLASTVQWQEFKADHELLIVFWPLHSEASSRASWYYWGLSIYSTYTALSPYRGVSRSIATNDTLLYAQNLHNYNSLLQRDGELSFVFYTITAREKIKIIKWRTSYPLRGKNNFYTLVLSHLYFLSLL